MTTFSPLYLSAFLPDSIHFKTVQSNQGWVLFRDSLTNYQLHVDAPYYNKMIVPSYFPSNWTRTYPSGSVATSRSSIKFKDLIAVLGNSDVQINPDVHSASFIDLINQVINLNPKQAVLLETLAADCKQLWEDIKLSGQLGKITSVVRLFSRKTLYSRYILINVLLRDGVEFPSLKASPSISIEIHAHPFKPNAISVLVIQNPIVMFNNPFLISNVIDAFKSALISKGYDVE